MYGLSSVSHRVVVLQVNWPTPEVEANSIVPFYSLQQLTDMVVFASAGLGGMCVRACILMCASGVRSGAWTHGEMSNCQWCFSAVCRWCDVSGVVFDWCPCQMGILLSEFISSRNWWLMAAAVQVAFVCWLTHRHQVGWFTAQLPSLPLCLKGL